MTGNGAKPVIRLFDVTTNRHEQHERDPVRDIFIRRVYELVQTVRARSRLVVNRATSLRVEARATFFVLARSNVVTPPMSRHPRRGDRPSAGPRMDTEAGVADHSPCRAGFEKRRPPGVAELFEERLRLAAGCPPK